MRLNFTNGWRAVTRRVNWLMVTLFCIPVSVCGDGMDSDGEIDFEAPPSMELLEFLGDWELEDGEWFDPTGASEQEIQLESWTEQSP